MRVVAVPFPEHTSRRLNDSTSTGDITQETIPHYFLSRFTIGINGFAVLPCLYFSKPFRSKRAAIFLGERHGGFGGADAVAVR